MESPLMIAFAMIYTLLGVGGSTIYAGCLGRYETEKADKVFTVTMLMGGTVALLTLIIGFVFIGPLSGLMCKAVEYQPAFGCPEKGTFLNITANREDQKGIVRH